MDFRILDLFCGAGGFSYGLDSLRNFKTVIGVDFDNNALNTFQKNFNESLTICGDISNHDVKTRIINLSKEKKVNMIIGGPPCQGFSLKGKNLGLEDPRNFLFLDYLDIVKEIQPEIFIIENVKNILYSSEKFFINKIVNDFHKLGYIINYEVLNAKNFGVPQNRERAIIIGSKSKNIILENIKTKSFVTVRDAISDLSYLESGEGEFEAKYLNKANSVYQKTMRNNSKFLYNHQATSHSKEALYKLSLIPPEGDKTSLPTEMHGKQKFSTTWSRLIWDDCSPTIDTRFDTPSNGRNSHPVLNRAITPREAARIQSFPDTFIFYGKKCSVCKQIGNAVPPLLAKYIGEQINNSYSEIMVKKDNYEIYLSNALSIVKNLINNNVKVDSIITDPPYNISKENNFGTLKNPRQGVDFGNWDNNFNVCKWIEDYSKILNKNGSMIIFCSYLFISDIVRELQKNSMSVKDIIVWKKTNPMPRNIERRYVQDMEFAIWAVKGDGKWVFNKPKNVPYLRSMFEFSLVSGNEKTGHPTQKKLSLMEEIIKIHTNENDLIIDPFMGSGTTGVAALKTKRRFVGIELNNDYFEIAKKRLDILK